MSYSVNELKDELVKTLSAEYGYDASEATILQMYGTVLTVVQQKLLQKRGEYTEKMKNSDQKRIYYMSME